MNDLIASLRIRLSLLVDDISDEGESGGIALDTADAWALPQRAHVDIGGGISLCDHISEGENISDSADRLCELTGVQVMRRSRPIMPSTDLKALLS